MSENKPKKHTKIEERTITVHLTETEIVTRARALSDVLNAATELEDEMKKEAAKYKDQIKGKEVEARRLSHIVKTGDEEQDKEVLIEYHTPAVGCKRTSILDTGEEISVEKMTEAECQGVLDFPVGASAPEPGEISPEVMQSARDGIVAAGKASGSIVQRSAKVGWQQAKRILEALELEGFIGPEDDTGIYALIAEGSDASAEGSAAR
jgi:DNA segregation ATPase FtsK/SpoIIIE-like protein